MKAVTSLGMIVGGLLIIGSQAIYTVNPGERVRLVISRHWFLITSEDWNKMYIILAIT